MSSLLLFIPIAIVLVAVQATLIERITLAGGQPDIILVSLVLWTMQSGRAGAYLPAVLMALVFDAISGLPLGITVLPLLAAVYLAGFGERSLFGARLGWPAFVTFVASIVAGLITLAGLSLFGWEVPWTEMILWALLPSAMLNIILLLFLYFPAEYLRSRRTLGFE